jgi:hypothetical protein
MKLLKISIFALMIANWNFNLICVKFGPGVSSSVTGSGKMQQQIMKAGPLGAFGYVYDQSTDTINLASAAAPAKTMPVPTAVSGINVSLPADVVTAIATDPAGTIASINEVLNGLGVRAATRGNSVVTAFFG